MPKMEVVMDIIFGMNAPSLKEQGLTGACIEHCQEDVDAIARLNMRGILSDAKALDARKEAIELFKHSAKLFRHDHV